MLKPTYTRIDFIMNDLDVTRQTAAKYLDQLTEAGLLSKHRFGKSNYYMNDPLVEIFVNMERQSNRQETEQVLTVP